MIVDAHVHVVAADRDRYPLHPGTATHPWYEDRPCDATELRALMADAGVDRAVVVQAVGAYSFVNDYVLDAAAAHPGVLTPVVCTDRTAPDPVGAVGGLVRGRGARGYRWFAVGADPRLDEPVGLWTALAALRVPVLVVCFPDRLGELVELLATRAPVPLVLDHCGFAAFDHGVPDALAALAAFPNVHLKVTTEVIRAAAAAGDAPAVVAELMALAGGRCLWGSDWSQTHDVPYAALVEEGRRAAEHLDADARAAYLGGTALALWPELARSRRG